MNPEEFEPSKPKAALKDLTIMSVGELQEYIESLKAKISRAESMIAQKQAHKAGIANIFKS